VLLFFAWLSGRVTVVEREARCRTDTYTFKWLIYILLCTGHYKMYSARIGLFYKKFYDNYRTINSCYGYYYFFLHPIPRWFLNRRCWKVQTMRYVWAYDRHSLITRTLQLSSTGKSRVFHSCNHSCIIPAWYHFPIRYFETFSSPNTAAGRLVKCLDCSVES